MQIFRIVKNIYKSSALDGNGAATYGGRWNFVDIPTVYCAQNRSLALLESFVNISQQDILPDDLFLLTINIPDLIDSDYMSAESCPKGWDDLPYSTNSQVVFSDFSKVGERLALALPSVVVPEEYNVLLNPRHELMSEVKVVSERLVVWDNRF